MAEGRRRSRSTGVAGGLVAILVAFACATPACSDDTDDPSGTGGQSATGGKPGTGGKGGGTGGKGSGGSGTGGSATGGRASGGAGTGGQGTGGAEPDGGCRAPQILHYPEPGCNAEPVCGGPQFDACAIDVCACDGTTLSGCGNYSKPWKRQGSCSDGGPGDGGDASTDAQPD